MLTRRTWFCIVGESGMRFDSLARMSLQARCTHTHAWTEEAHYKGYKRKRGMWEAAGGGYAKVVAVARHPLQRVMAPVRVKVCDPMRESSIRYVLLFLPPVTGIMCSTAHPSRVRTFFHSNGSLPGEGTPARLRAFFTSPRRKTKMSRYRQGSDGFAKAVAATVKKLRSVRCRTGPDSVLPSLVPPSAIASSPVYVR